MYCFVVVLYFLRIAPLLRTSFVVPWVRVSNPLYASLRLLKAFSFAISFQDSPPCQRFKSDFFTSFIGNSVPHVSQNGTIGRESPPILSAQSLRLSRWLSYPFTPIQVCLPSGTHLLLFLGSYAITWVNGSSSQNNFPHKKNPCVLSEI